MITTTPLACGSSNPRAIKAAAEFPAKLFAVHGGKIVLRDTAIYLGSSKPIDVSCSICKHEWAPRADNLLIGQGCPECKRLNAINSAGKLRCPRATPEEKAKAVLLRSEGHTLKAIAEMLGRSQSAIIKWVDPEQAEKARIRNNKWTEENREQKRANDRRYYKEFKHGVENSRIARNKRRALQWEALFDVFVDGEWHEVEMYEHLQNWDDRQMFVDFQSCEDYAKMVATCKELEEIHGEPFHCDHLVPLSKGGLHHTHNLKIVPASYNLSKNNKRIPEDDTLFCKRIFGIN
jgi:transposase